MEQIVKTVPVVKAWMISDKVAKKLHVDSPEIYDLYGARFEGPAKLVYDRIPNDVWDLTNDYEIELEEFFRCVMAVAQIGWGDEFIAEFA